MDETTAMTAPNSPASDTRAVELAAEQEILEQNHPILAPENMELSPVLSRLPVEMDVAIPVQQFRVRNLLSLEPGQVIETEWPNGEDMPLAAGKVQLAWSEFEVVEQQLAVRVTRLN